MSSKINSPFPKPRSFYLPNRSMLMELFREISLNPRVPPQLEEYSKGQIAGSWRQPYPHQPTHALSPGLHSSPGEGRLGVSPAACAEVLLISTEAQRRRRKSLEPMDFSRISLKDLVSQWESLIFLQQPLSISSLQIFGGPWTWVAHSPLPRAPWDRDGKEQMFLHYWALCLSSSCPWALSQCWWKEITVPFTCTAPFKIFALVIWFHPDNNRVRKQGGILIVLVHMWRNWCTKLLVKGRAGTTLSFCSVSQCEGKMSLGKQSWRKIKRVESWRLWTLAFRGRTHFSAIK